MKATFPVFVAAMLVAACQQPAAVAPKADSTAAADATTNYNTAQKAYAAANAKMHGAMSSSIDADADVAFMAGMIPHHEGAVAMAQIALDHGKDPEVRALAEKVIAAQAAEITQMKAWLAKRGVKPAASAEAEADHSAMGH